MPTELYDKRCPLTDPTATATIILIASCRLNWMREPLSARIGAIYTGGGCAAYKQNMLDRATRYSLRS